MASSSTTYIIRKNVEVEEFEFSSFYPSFLSEISSKNCRLRHDQKEKTLYE